jgi:PAS domain S-box-containing protein
MEIDMQNPLRSKKSSFYQKQGALRIAGLYLLIGVLWILLSDRFVADLFSNPQTRLILSTAKGWFYVVVTAVLLYLLVQREMNTLRAVQEKNLISERHYQLMTQGANDGFWEWDPKSGEVTYSARSKEMLGYEVHDLDSNLETWKQLVHPDDVERVMNLLADLLAGRAERLETEMRMRHQSGRYLDILFRVAVFWPDPYSIHLVGAQTDITDRKHAEEALHRFELISEHSRDIILFMRRSDGQIVEANHAAAEAYGYRREELCSMKIQDLRGDPNKKLTEEQLEKADTEGLLFGTVHRRKDGSIFPVEISSKGATIDGKRMLISVIRDISARKQIEDNLRASEQTLQLFVEYAPASIAMFDRNMCYIAASQRFLLDYRIHEPNIIGRSHYDIFPEIPERWKEIHRRCLAGGVESCEEDSFPRQDGSVDWVRWEIHPWYQPSGDIGGIILFSEVVTDRKVAQQKIIENENKLRTLFEILPIGISILDENRRIVYTNPALQKNLEIDSTQWAQGIYRARQYLRSDGTPMSTDEFASVRAVREQRAIYDVETGVVKEDGSLIWLSVSAVPTNVADWRVILVNMNITDRKKAENALRQSEERFSKAFLASPAALSITSLLDAHFVDVNDSFISMFGYTRSEVIGRRAEELNLYPELVARKEMGRQLREKGFIREYELKTRTKTGEERYALISAEILQLESNKHIISIIYDITQRKQDEESLRRTAEELVRSNAELEQFAYVASHDLQEPLRAVAGMVQLLQQRYQGKLDERADEYIEHAVSAATRMQGLINDLLAFSRVDRKGKPFDWVSIERVILAVQDNLMVTIRENDASITHDPLPSVYGDDTQLIQLFQNLIGNAIKFRSQEQPKIHISAEQQPEKWVFSIRDNGIGIEPQYFERIFAVFQRLHTRREYPGTGIGLAICKKIVERHNGQIWVDSQPGQGSTFYFTIPIRRQSNVNDPAV